MNAAADGAHNKTLSATNLRSHLTCFRCAGAGSVAPAVRKRHHTYMSGFSTWQIVVLVVLAAIIGWFVASMFRKKDQRQTNAP